MCELLPMLSLLGDMSVGWSAGLLGDMAVGWSAAFAMVRAGDPFVTLSDLPLRLEKARVKRDLGVVGGIVLVRPW